MEYQTLTGRKDMMLRVIERRARRRTAALACALIRAEPAERAALQADLAFERWLADSCWRCLYGP
jgi:hypothetical protein